MGRPHGWNRRVITRELRQTDLTDVPGKEADLALGQGVIGKTPAWSSALGRR
jgi:hypothetical protein